MTTLIALAPTHRGGAEAKPQTELAQAFEIACDHLDEIGSAPFSYPGLSRSCGHAGAARQLIKAYLALGFIERVNDSQGRRPVLYRVMDHALPRGSADAVLASLAIFDLLVGAA